MQQNVECLRNSLLVLKDICADTKPDIVRHIEHRLHDEEEVKLYIPSRYVKGSFTSSKVVQACKKWLFKHIDGQKFKSELV